MKSLSIKVSKRWILLIQLRNKRTHKFETSAIHFKSKLKKALIDVRESNEITEDSGLENIFEEYFKDELYPEKVKQ